MLLEVEKRAFNQNGERKDDGKVSKKYSGKREGTERKIEVKQNKARRNYHASQQPLACTNLKDNHHKYNP